MKLLALPLALFGFLLLSSLPSAARADGPDKKPAKADAAKPGKEVTLTGTFGCAKCSFKEANACQNVLKVKTGDKVDTYELAPNAVAKDHHEAVCHSPGVPATVKGTVSDKDGKKVLTASKIDMKE
jgi:hypothetical protein